MEHMINVAFVIRKDSVLSFMPQTFPVPFCVPGPRPGTPWFQRGGKAPVSSAQGLTVPASSVEVVPCPRPLRAPGRCSSAGRLGSSLGLTWSGPWAERHWNASTPSLSSACLNHSPQGGPQVLLPARAPSARQHPGGALGHPMGLGGGGEMEVVMEVGSVTCAPCTVLAHGT